MTTVSDLRDKVLKKLAILGNGQTASADDAQIVEDAINELHEELEERGLAYWGSVTDMTNAVIPHFVYMVLPRVSEEFEKYEQLQELKAERSEQMIVKLASYGISGEPVEADYF